MITDKNRIQKIEIQSFIKFWLNNTNDKIKIVDGITIENDYLINLYSEFLNTFYKQHTKYKIFGVDKASDFLINLSDLNTLNKICIDIWNNPKEYSKSNEDDYYDFLKFLWVTIDISEPIRLGDYVGYIDFNKKIIC